MCGHGHVNMTLEWQLALENRVAPHMDLRTRISSLARSHSETGAKATPWSATGVARVLTTYIPR